MTEDLSRHRSDQRSVTIALVSLTNAAVAADLVPSGLEFLERIGEEVSLPLPPPPPYHSPASCGPEHGRFDSDEMIDVDDPEMPAKVNADCRTASGPPSVVQEVNAWT